MGFLTDLSTNRYFLYGILKKWEKSFVIVSYIAGIIWFLLLSYKPYNLGCYFSENALLPGLVDVSYNNGGKFFVYLKSLQNLDVLSESTIFQWILKQFEMIGLDSYIQQFQFKYSDASLGANVFGILSAARSNAAEALVVSIPYRNASSFAGVALLLSIAEHFIEKPYWSKNIIFLIHSHENLGIQAWLQAYHKLYSKNSLVIPSDLEKHYGLLQVKTVEEFEDKFKDLSINENAAIHLDISSLEFNYIDVQYLGYNGQLPNLDLVNLVHRLCIQENLKHTQEALVDHHQSSSKNDWVWSLKTMLSLMSYQATGMATNYHGEFLSFGIQAVTLKGSTDFQTLNRKKYSLISLGRVLEGTLRSLNNLLERLHQSFFFYLMPQTDRFISIGLYMPPFLLTSLGLFIQALLLWFEAQKVKFVTWMEVLKFFALIHIHFLFFLSIFNKLSYFILTEKDQWKFKLSSFHVIVLVSCIIVFFISSRNKRLNWQLLKFVTLIELLCFLYTLAVLNFSLAFIGMVLCTPAFCSANPLNTGLVKFVSRVILILIHPLILIMYFALHQIWNSSNSLHFMELFYNCQEIILTLAISFKVFNVWLAPAVYTLFLPLWYLIWSNNKHNLYFDHENIISICFFLIIIRLGFWLDNKHTDEDDEMDIEKSKERLYILATKMDTNHDYKIDKKELKTWIVSSFRKLSEEESEEKFLETDINNDNVVSWSEYLQQTYDHTEGIGKKDEQKVLNEDEKLFFTADKNSDGVLDKSEFLSFSHPEEDAEMLPVLINQTLNAKDKNRDGRLSFEEYLSSNGQQPDEDLIVEKTSFLSEYDKNGDGFLDKDEIGMWLAPDNELIASEEVEHLFQISDDDNDDMLTYDEIVLHHEAFVGSEATDYGDHLRNIHDEL